MRGGSNQTMYKCENCGRTFPGWWERDNHAFTHVRIHYGSDGVYDVKWSRSKITGAFIPALTPRVKNDHH
jgi:hypothetical protein